MRISLSEALIGAAICGAVGVVSQDLLTILATAVLLIGLKLTWTNDGLFVLAAAFAFHWMETSIGLLYRGLFGREVPTFAATNYAPMVLIALGCCLSIAIGLRLGMGFVKMPENADERPQYAFSFGLLVVVYVIATALESTLAAAAGEFPSLRQIIVTADTARLGVLFLLLRRLLVPHPRWMAITGILVLEVGLGITGFFAGFREPLVLAALAMMEIFDRRSTRHWVAMSAACVGAVAFALLWMGIRGQYRSNFTQVDNFETSRSARLDSIQTLTTDFFRSDATAMWETADKLVDRMWPIYYPVLAYERVPSHVARTNGAIFTAALTHIVTPRVLFPGKPELESDSEKVRRYSGVMVAGAEQNTSIAFGYAAEAYVDFGVPLMFAPVFAFGLVMGWLYGLFRKLIVHHELFVAFGTVTFWLSLYLFERSWATMLGMSLAMFIYLGLPVLVLDRFLLIRHVRRHGADGIFVNEPTSSHLA